jgi:signal transduction histidine kinase
MEQLETMQQILPLLLGQDRPREEAQAGTMDALRSTFIRNVSHEFRTPLGIVLGYAELLYDEGFGALESEQKQALSIIVNHLHELRTLVERISILMAVETSALAMAPVNVTQMTGQVLRKKRTEAERAEVTLVASFEPDMPRVLGDMHQLEQAVECLVENALKFTPQGGRVQVEVYAEPDWVCLAVSDNGIGISERELERIFSGFYQVDGSTTRQYGGIGLGLTLIKAVAEAHGGWVEVESRLNQGSHFLVKLPACELMPRQLNLPGQWHPVEEPEIVTRPYTPDIPLWMLIEPSGLHQQAMMCPPLTGGQPLRTNRRGSKSPH